MSFPISTVPSSASRAVAVIGAGAAGLCTALELRREGHQVVVYEREDGIGGTWAYTPQTETDPMGVDPTRRIVHTSLYASLRTNLPREVMGFRVYPFVASHKPGRDGRRFPGHAEVLEYLRDFARVFGLEDLVRFGREVWHVELVEDRKWMVKSRKTSGGGGGGRSEADDKVYDAVVVCNGHYTEPRIADIPGMDAWPGKQIHSHNYRVPDPFRDQIVVLIGGSASSDDISREIAKVAKEVHISSRSVEGSQLGKLPYHDNIWVHSMIERVGKDGTVVFHDQTEVYGDVIVHCTGYKYDFPFLKTNGIVTVEDNRVGPLYKHIFPPTLAPWLSFVGLPWKVVPFPLFEYQSKWIAGILSGRISLSSTEEMVSDINSFYALLDAAGIPKRYTHRLDSDQFDYDDWLGARSGSSPVEEWRKKMYRKSGLRKRREPETYRDQWDDQDLILQAHEDFKQYILEASKL